MAMRGALTHRKTRRLAKIMGIAQPFALGLMESLWHVTAEQAPTGAIGRLSNQDIADEMFWDGNADELIDALVSADLLEHHPRFRLIVHNYHKYADQATKRKVERHGLEFAVSVSECLAMTSQQLDVAGLPVPVPVPESSTRVQSPESEDDFFEEASKAKPESMQEVNDYADKIKLPRAQAEAWLDRTKTVGWVYGPSKIPVKDWKASMRTWKKNWAEIEARRPSSNGMSHTPPSKSFTDEDLDRVNRPWKYTEDRK